MVSYVLFFLILAALFAVVGYLLISFYKKHGCSVHTLGTVSPAFFSGFLLFWICRTAVERRILGLCDLFSFFRNGTPLCGMLLLLLGCLVICLFLGLASPGESLCRRLDRIYQKKGAPWLISLAVTVLLFAWLLRITVPAYMTNDEVDILNVITDAAANGLQAAANTFSHVLFCGLISLFYRLAPNGYWYIGYHLAALLSSCVIIGRCILLKNRIHGWSVFTGCFIYLLSFCGIFAAAFAQISFTVTPAVLGSAAIALLLCRDDLTSRAGQIVSDIFCVILMLLCYLQRKDTGKCLLCFWGLAMAYQIIKLLLARKPGWKRCLSALALSALSLFLLLFAANSVSSSGPYSRDPDYSYAESYRSLIGDYLINDLTVEEYADAGIPQELATLLHGWYFMDERITTETFRELANIYYANHPASVLEAAVSSPLTHLKSLLKAVSGDKQMLCPALCGIALLFLCFASFVRYGRRYWLNFLCALCAFGGSFIFCWYLAAGGRFLLRVFLVAVIPALVIMLMIALSVPLECPAVSKRRCITARVLALVSGTMFGISCLVCVYNVPYGAEYADRRTLFADQWAVEDYANANADISYITNLYDANLDPLHTPQYPDNLILWGAVGDTYRTEGRLYGSDFFRDDVQFMCHTPTYITFLLQYLTLDNGPVAAVDTAHVTDSVYVYDISQITPGADYTGWYEQNGLTYYFENGKAVTGAKTIDGVEYEFAPAGAEAGLTVSTDGGTGQIVYTTSAYSLVSDE